MGKTPFKLKGFSGFASDVSKFQSNLTKKHTLYKGKKLTLKAQVNTPEANLSWNPKGTMTKYGSPKISFSNSANLSGSYKIGKSTTLSGGVSYASKKAPRYTAGIKINL